MSTAQTVSHRSLVPGYQIPRLIRGGWQLAGDHGPVLAQRAVEDMALFAQAGLNTFDCADIYTGVEEMIGPSMRNAPSRPRTAVFTRPRLVTLVDASMWMPPTLFHGE